MYKKNYIDFFQLYSNSISFEIFILFQNLNRGEKKRISDPN